MEVAGSLWCFLLFCAASLINNIALCAVDSDQIVSLPGFSGQLPTRQFSGYLPPVGGSKTKNYHYW